MCTSFNKSITSSNGGNTMTLEIQNLYVEVEGKEIIKGISLTFEPGKVHALMGPNGSGKSTLAKALTGHPNYKITKGKILLDGQDITSSPPDQRSKAGLFMSFQNPTSVKGVTIGNFIRAAVNARREKPYSVVKFHKLLKDTMAELKIDPSFNRRYLNTGFSGGEKKRAEILQMVMLQPKYALLDETDSGLDIDAIKLVSEQINILKEKYSISIIIITHYQRFLENLSPDVVSIIREGEIIATGKKELANQIEQQGFEAIQ